MAAEERWHRDSSMLREPTPTYFARACVCVCVCVRVEGWGEREIETNCKRAKICTYLLRASCWKFFATRRWRMARLCLHISPRFVWPGATQRDETLLLHGVTTHRGPPAWSVHIRSVWFVVSSGSIGFILITFPGFPVKLTTHLHPECCSTLPSYAFVVYTRTTITNCAYSLCLCAPWQISELHHWERSLAAAYQQCIKSVRPAVSAIVFICSLLHRSFCIH